MDEVTIEVYLPESTTGLTIDVIAQDGRLVKQLASKMEVSRGTQIFKWNGRNSQNTTVASGVYYLKIKTDSKELHQKIIFHK
jgi:flagellar hook assembly protein FlgD